MKLYISTLLLLLSLSAFAQPAPPAQPFVLAAADRDTFIHDTISGMALVTDSLVIMRPGKTPGEYQFANVLGGLFVQAYLIKQYRLIVRASDGSTVPFDTSQKFVYANTWGTIDPRRIAIFKTDANR